MKRAIGMRHSASGALRRSIARTARMNPLPSGGTRLPSFGNPKKKSRCLEPGDLVTKMRCRCK